MRRQRQKRKLATAALTGLLAAGLGQAMAESAAGQSVQLPSVDLSSLGQLGVIGQFEGISTYQYQGQQDMASGELSSSDGLIQQSSDTVFLALSQTDGQIKASCALDGVVYYAGNFTKTGDTETAGIGSYNVSSQEVTALSNGPNGTINALYCDTDSSSVYVGGEFQFDNGSSVAVWSTADQSWSLPAFGGFKQGSSINAITQFGSSIIFGGSFSGLQNSSLLGTNGTAGEQLVSFNSVTAYGYNGESGQDADAPLCPSGDGWRVVENAQGSWGVTLNFTFNPTRMRLYNLNDDTNGVKTFRLMSYPSNGIMNLTYVDPSSGETVACDAWCTLPQHQDQEYMDFEFVNVVATKGFQLFLLDYYGNQAGIGGVEMFQDDMVTFAINDLNQPRSCQAGETTGGADVSNSDWNVSTVDDTMYLETTVTDTAAVSDMVVSFRPNITSAGNYTVHLYTPGCLDDGTCSSRGGANITVYASSDEDPVSTVIYQTNNYQKYDTVFSGILDPTDGFDVRVDLAPLTPVSQTPFTFVAQKVQWILNGNVTQEIEIKNLLEFDPSNFTDSSNATETPIGQTAINNAGPALGNSSVTVNALYATSDALLIGGSFDSDQGSNIVSVASDADAEDPLSGVASGGLNGTVHEIKDVQDRQLVILGDFEGTKNGTESGLSGIAFYDYSSDEWSSLGAGVTGGSVLYAVPISINDTDTLAVSGNFTEVSANSSSSDSVSGFALYLLSENTWQQFSNMTSPVVEGRLSCSSNYGNGTLYFGGLKITSSGASGAVTLGDSLTSLSPLPFEFSDSASSSSSNSTNSTSSLKKRTGLVADSEADNVINTAIFVNDSLSIYGGAFAANDSNGEAIHNLVLVNGTSSFGLPGDPFSDNGSVYSLYSNGNRLYVGGNFNATVNGNGVNGLVFFDLNNQSYPTQPPGINGGESLVTYVTQRPDSSELVVMGSFERAGGLGCPSFCVYDLSQNRWNAPTSGLSGIVSTGTFLSTDILFFAGQLTMNDSTVYFGQYDFSTSSFSSIDELSEGLPGPVNSFVLNGEGTSSMFASGTNTNSSTSFLAYWNDTAWTFIDDLLSEGTVITSLSIMPLQSGHSANSILPSDELLLVSGNIVLQDFGNASTVMFDGSSWQPLFITTSSSGSGSINSVFSQNEKSFSSLLGEKYMARGFVVLVSLAIAVGLILLIVLLGLLVAYIRKRRQGYRPAPTRVNEEQMTQTVPPENLFREFSHSNNGAR